MGMADAWGPRGQNWTKRPEGRQSLDLRSPPRVSCLACGSCWRVGRPHRCRCTQRRHVAGGDTGHQLESWTWPWKPFSDACQGRNVSRAVV